MYTAITGQSKAQDAKLQSYKYAMEYILSVCNTGLKLNADKIELIKRKAIRELEKNNTTN